MAQKSFEDREYEELIRKQAEYTQQLQRTITGDADVEKWVSDGHWSFLERRIFAELEREAFQTIKNPAFDPANLSQVAQLKALCQVFDVIRARIEAKVQGVADARNKLNDLEKSALPV